MGEERQQPSIVLGKRAIVLSTAIPLMARPTDLKSLNFFFCESYEYSLPSRNC